MTSLAFGKIRPGYWLYRTFWVGVDWIYPPTCGGCQKFGVRWCEDCQSKVNKLDQTICPKCGSFEPHNFICSSCRENPPLYEASRSWGRFHGPLRAAIHRLKYKNDIGLAEALSKHLIELFTASKWEVDLVTAVPLSLKRRAERGYNQSNLLARPIALACGILFQPNAIDRARDTLSQVGLSAQKRRENVRDAFIAKPGLVEGKAVLIVDDVFTTGSTIQSCTQAFLDAGARCVYGLTLAKSMLEDDVQLITQAAVPAGSA
jgi:competence protein ComFC